MSNENDKPPIIRHRMVCSNCGSEDVVRDAWAEWDIETQTWVMRGDPFDDGYCNDCENSGNSVIDMVDEQGNVV